MTNSRVYYIRRKRFVYKINKPRIKYLLRRLMYYTYKTFEVLGVFAFFASFYLLCVMLESC